MMSQHENPLVNCPVCNVLLTDTLALEIHLDTGHCGAKLGRVVRNLRCEFCLEVFSNHKELQEHQVAECLPKGCNGEGRVISEKCNICDKVFSSKKDMMRHVWTVHKGVKLFKCSTCGINFGMKGNLQQHIKTVHQMSRPFPCPDCRKSFAKKSDLKVHQEGVHEGVHYPCTSCMKTFTLKKNLDTHFKNVHQKQTKYSCDHCKEEEGVFVTMDPRTLKRHKLKKHPREYEVEVKEYETNHSYVCK